MIRRTTKGLIQRVLSLVGYELTPLDTNTTNKPIALANQRFQQISDELEKTPELKTDDVFVVSYPSSGMALVRNVIAHILYPHERLDALKNLDQLVPEIHKGIPSHNNYSHPRVIKTHQQFPFRHARQNKALYSKVIYIVRHPFDIIHSYYYSKRSSNPKLSLEEVVYEFMLGSTNWGSWQEHVLSWKAAEEDREIIFIRYEDFWREPVETIAKLANFLGTSLNSEQVEQISKDCSLKDVVEIKAQSTDKFPKFQPTSHEADKKVREKDLTPEMKEFIVDCCKFTMNLFDYSVNPSPLDKLGHRDMGQTSTGSTLAR